MAIVALEASIIVTCKLQGNSFVKDNRGSLVTPNILLLVGRSPDSRQWGLCYAMSVRHRWRFSRALGCLRCGAHRRCSSLMVPIRSVYLVGDQLRPLAPWNFPWIVRFFMLFCRITYPKCLRLSFLTGTFSCPLQLTCLFVSLSMGFSTYSAIAVHFKGIDFHDVLPQKLALNGTQRNSGKINILIIIVLVISPVQLSKKNNRNNNKIRVELIVLVHRVVQQK